MAGSLMRVVGWINRMEWVLVYEELYSQNPVKQKHALDRIAVWKCRTETKLSTAIECTWELVSAELYFHWAREEANLSSFDKQLRIMYAMALTRFLNLITESSQNARHPLPVHHLASDMGLPRWLVDLRHDAVHSNLPSLAVLRTAVQTALAWLKVEYWEAQLAEDAPYLQEQVEITTGTPISEVVEKMKQGLETYTEEFYQVHFEKEDDPTTAEKQHLGLVIKDIEGIILANRGVALPVVVQEGFLLHTVDQLEAFNIDPEAFMNDPSLQLPQALIELWAPLLVVIHNMRATQMLIELLLAIGEERSKLQVRQAASWVVAILTSVASEGNGGQLDELCPCYAKSRERVQAGRILKTCLENPTVYTTTILKILNQRMDINLTGQQEAQLAEVLRIFTDQNVTNIEDGSPRTTTDVIYDTNHLNTKSQQHEWQGCPLGYCPGAPVTFTSLELPESVNHLASSCSLSPAGRPPSTPTRQRNTGKRQRGKATGRNSSEEETDIPQLSRPAQLEWMSSEMNTLQQQISIF